MFDATNPKSFNKYGLQTIETNIRNISTNKFEIEYLKDPLFHKISEKFD